MSTGTRSFTWKSCNVEQLFKDAESGDRLLLRLAAAAYWLGALLSIAWLICTICGFSGAWALTLLISGFWGMAHNLRAQLHWRWVARAEILRRMARSEGYTLSINGEEVHMQEEVLA